MPISHLPQLARSPDQYSHGDWPQNCLLLYLQLFGTMMSVSRQSDQEILNRTVTLEGNPRDDGDNFMQRHAFILAAMMLAATPLLANDMPAPINADGLKWGPAPPVFPRGAQIAVVSGDPFKDGLYVVRLKMPANYKIPAHNHPTSEYVTVVSGRFHIGMGDKLDEKKGIELRAGGFAEAPPRMNHYAWTSAETVVQVHGQGPFALTYVNPADDPSK